MRPGPCHQDDPEWRAMIKSPGLDSVEPGVPKALEAPNVEGNYPI